MKILITNINIDFFKEIDSSLIITPSTKNTSHITCTPKKFAQLFKAVKEKGANPFAVMTW